MLSCPETEQFNLLVVEHVQLKPIDVGAIVNKKSATSNTNAVTGILTTLVRPNYPMKSLTRSKDRPISSQSHNDAVPQAKSLCKLSRSSSATT